MNCRVALYGASLFMAVIEAALGEQPGYTIARVDAAQGSATDIVMALAPQVLLIDDATCQRQIDTLCATLRCQAPAIAVVVLPLKSFVLHNQMQRHPIQDRTELMDLITVGHWRNRCV